LETEGEEIEKMLNGYIVFLKKSKQGENEPGANYRVREDAEHYEIKSSEDSNNHEDTAL
jgi:hypothetical protein